MISLAKLRRLWTLRSAIRFFLTLLAALSSAALAQVCALPGNNGSPSISGVVNSYWTAAAGTYGPTSTSIGLSNRRGANVNISEGDLVLVIQMQCADINTTDTLAYGDGVPGEPASGYTDPAGSCLAGRYEFVRAGAGSSASILSLTGSPLQHSYVQAAATNTAGRRTVQIIRVPQYQDLTLSGTVAAAVWNGSTGGIVALDVAGTLNLNGQSINVDGQGFRGGGGRDRAATDTQERFRWDADTRHGSKGEGIAGTPRFVSNKRSPDNGDTADITDLGSGWGGYPTGTARTGDFARGAPGNAGGGGAFWNSSSDNGGGGGGGNGGAGGRGGAGWRSAGYSGILPDYSNLPDKKWGFGGARFAAAGVTRLVLGGGGGAGDNNNNSAAVESSGAAGGGIVMVRAGLLTGTGTISARGGRAADNPLNDGAGGGGAGGSVLVIAPTWQASLTINAQGGRGGDSYRGGGSAHGPGGGGGGVVITSGAAAVNVAGGANGETNTADNPPGGRAHGAQPGIVSVANLVSWGADTPGANAGYRCLAIDLRLTKTPTLSGPQPGDTISYQLTVTNPSSLGASGVVVTDTLPAGLQVTSLPAECSQAGQVVTCSIGALANGASVTVAVTATVLNQSLGTQLTNSASVSAAQRDPTPANNSATATVTVSGLVLAKAVCNVTASDCSNPANFLTSVPARPGQVLEYRVSYSRVGPPIFELILRDDVPTGTQLVTGAYGANQDIALTCPDQSIHHLAIGSVTSFSIDLAARCVLSTATRPGGATAEALLNGQGGAFRFRVRIP